MMKKRIFAAGHQPAADHILERFEIFGSMGSMVQSICDCSAVQSAVSLSKCLATAPALDNIDLNQMSRYVSGVLQNEPSTSAHLIDRCENVNLSYKKGQFLTLTVDITKNC